MRTNQTTPRPSLRRGQGDGLARRLFLRLAAWAVALSLSPAAAWACPVCYGAADNSMIDGAKASVLFMGALVYCLLGAAVAVFFVLRRHARKLADQRPDTRRGLELVHRPEGVAR